MKTDRRVFAEINTSSAGDNAIIAAPSSGHIEIDQIMLLPSGGANLITFDLGADQFEFAFDDNQAFTYDNITNINPLTVDDKTAFILNLGSASKVTGFILARIVGEN